jgi:WD40 repeat protein
MSRFKGFCWIVATLGAFATAAHGQEPLTLRGHDATVIGVGMSADGKLVASASLDNTVRVWDASTGRERHVLRGHAHKVHAVAFSRSAAELFTAGGQQGHGQVKAWDLSTGSLKADILEVSYTATSLAISPDEHFLAIGCAGPNSTGGVKLWDLVAGREVRAYPPTNCEIGSVAFSPDGKRLVGGGADGTVRTWPLDNDSPGPVLSGHSGSVTSICFTPDGSTLVTSSLDRTVRLWDMNRFCARAVLMPHPVGIACAAVSPDGRLLVTGANDGIGIGKVWDREWLAERAVLRSHQASFICVAFSPDGKRLATGGFDRTVKVWDVESLLSPPQNAVQR